VGAIESDYPLLAIVGPTAAGKSSLAIALASRWNGEIINCDSVQLYRGFDIGTGKVSPQERQGIPHHLLDVVEPGQIFTAGDYRQEAIRVLAGVRDRQRLPIVVGGTGLYLRALLLGLFRGPQRSEGLRERLKSLAGRHQREFLHRMLKRLDPKAAARIHQRDTRKVIRALEVCLLARESITALHERGREGLQGFRAVKVGLAPNRQQLAQRINRRVGQMFRAGLLDEVRGMLSREDADRIKPLGAIGYRQACGVLRGEMSLEGAICETQTATRQYAKRQMTWFRRETDIKWFAGFGDDAVIQERVAEWLGGRLRLRADQLRPLMDAGPAPGVGDGEKR
jgi:tRNA dimethylallyltransferase